MGDYALIFQILGGLLAIFFIFLTVMNTKTWRWLHVTAVFLVFASVWGLALLAAMTLKARFNWVKAHDTLAKQVAEQESLYHDLIYGNPSAPDGGQDALMSRRGEYSRFILDRGRVLRQCATSLNADGTVTVQFAAPAAAAAAPGAAPPAGATPAAAPPAEGAAPAAAAAPPAAAGKNGFKVQEVVFAFVEATPSYYVGQFEVTAAADQTLTLRRTVPATPVVPAEAPAEFRWVIYETFPIDMHELFDVPLDKRQEELSKLFPPLPAEAPQDLKDAYGRMLASYLRDGQPAEDTDPPENVWIKVQFQRNHSVVVDAGALVSPIAFENFNSVGEAQIARLQRGGPVEFKKGEVAIFDSQTANTLISGGIATLGEGQARIYRRQLNDYENAFATISRRHREVAAEIARADQHLAELQGALAKANEQIRIQEAEKAMLEADVAKVTYEGKEVGKYRDALAAKVQETRTELSRLYSFNKKLRDDLKATSDRLTEEIDRRTREATAAASTP